MRRSLAAAIDGRLAPLPPDDPRRLRAQRQVAARLRDCGCTAGAVAFLVGAALAAAYVVMGHRHPVSIVLALAFTFAASLAGKAIGLAVATARLAVLAARLSHEVRRVDVH